MTGRHLIVVDTETTGLDPNVHVPVEVAAINVTTGEELRFVPYVSRDQLGAADPRAMQINRYYERGLFAQACPFRETKDWDSLWAMLRGNTLAGANPRFDAAMLVAGYASAQRAGGFLDGVGPHRDGEHPIYPVRTPRRSATPVLSPAQVATILDGCSVQRDGDWTGGAAAVRNRLFFAVLAETGMRLGEALSLRHNDFHIGAGATPWIEPEESWHFRLADLSAYTAGVLGLDPTDLPGLDRCCELCGVANEAPHTAMGDARATVACFQVLAGLAADGGVQ